MATTKWAIDPTHSEIGFKIKHMMFTNVSGKFENYDATITTEDDNFENAKMEFSADINSINTHNADRDTHLKSADFFDADNYPKLTFKSSSFSKTDEHNYTLTGDLSLRGITKSVQFPVEFSGLMKDPWGNTKAGLNISGKINRKDWGLNWNSALETGGVLVSEEVRLHIELQLVKL
ncbi:YceI family protein [Flavobacterium granuli]|uniref:Polyisoprenoid-binding protein YceI n=1 Tax=Flavobacterium granuli TaxID=280093 RepID=A0A1M5MVJ6_9FLAO|nr:YceI family protein [Flavobacterium granuli]PRZ25094.1 polyisoprenoid-binding protein YceI [Flavobacterium granuli]SHG81235.1 Polyisoprenoid-binding protein YceI [Flavobacterium granuli]